MSIKKEDNDIIVYREYKRIRLIRDFLIANSESMYNAEDIERGTEIKCADKLLYFNHQTYSKSVGIKMVEIIEQDGKYCSTERYYYCDQPTIKGWWKFWKHNKKKEETNDEI